MNNPNKIYTLTIAYNEDTEEVEYMQETISVEKTDDIEPSSILVDISDHWDEDTIKLFKDQYYLAEA